MTDCKHDIARKAYVSSKLDPDQIRLYWNGEDEMFQGAHAASLRRALVTAVEEVSCPTEARNKVVSDSRLWYSLWRLRAEYAESAFLGVPAGR